MPIRSVLQRLLRPGICAAVKQDRNRLQLAVQSGGSQRQVLAVVDIRAALEQQLAARRAKKLVKMEQNNAKERELVRESQAREGQAGGGASSVDDQASTLLLPSGCIH